MGSAQVVTGLVGSSSSTIMGLAPLATKCFLLVVRVTLAEGSQRVRRWNACNACNGGGGGGRGGRGCGSGAQGSCCSSQDCPHEAPVCSEWGYCQCSSYQLGGPECGPGFGSGSGEGCGGGSPGCGSFACGGGGGGGSSWGGGGGSNSGGGGCGGGCWKKKRSAVEQMIARYQQTDD